MVSGIISALSGLFKLAGLLTEYLRNNRLIEAGKAEAIADALQGAQRQLRKVQANRTKFRSDPDYANRLRKSFKRKPRS